MSEDTQQVLTIGEEVSRGSDAVPGADSEGFATNLMYRGTMERFVKRVLWRARDGLTYMAEWSRIE